MKRIICLLILILIVDGVVGQNNKFIARNTIFAEYSLEGAYYSLNYERIIAESKKLYYTLHAGISILPYRKAIPFGIDINTGQYYHHADFTLTVTPLVEKHNYIGSNGYDNDKFIYLFPGTGYRYQRPGGGFFFRVMAGPMILLDPAEGDFWNLDPKLKFTFSLGLGVNFGR